MAHEESQRVASWFYLGQALVRVGRFREAAEALGKAERLGQGMTGFYRLWSRAWLRAGKAERARLILEKGLVRYPRDSGLLREVALLYAEVGFFQAAIQTAQKITEADAAIGAQVWAVLLDRMRTKAGWSQHLKLLETLRLRFPRNDGILVRRCVAWATAQAHRTAATCFAQLADKMPDMAYYTAAAYLQAGDLFQAMRWNQRVPSEKRRRQQHAALLLTQRAYAQAFALLWPLWKAGNLEDSERYRLAYAALQIGRYTDSEQLLQSLRGTSMKSMGSALETVVRQCRKTPWLCVAR
jgi:tetratricopeptide (TPR) repeat protein